MRNVNALLGLITLLVLFASFTPIGLLVYPSYFPKPHFNFKEEPLTKDKIELGRALFYDPILSSDGTISCASCHSPYNAFAHTDHDLSHGINDQIGTRNAPALFNLAWQKNFMWDGASHHLDVQALAPISHPGEMNETIENVVKKLQSKSLYAPLFWKAFGDSTITGANTLKALSQFQLTLVSSNSKYDKVIVGQAEFSKQELQGYALFKQNCTSCHVEPLFSNYEFKNNGLAVDTTLKDVGRGKVTHLKTDSLLFKVPSLRNLSYTFPYMHDGRFEKLYEVLNHYTSGIVQHPTLSKELQKGIVLTANQKTDLIAFLLTLNDETFVFNPENKFPQTILLPSEGSAK